MNAEIKQKLQDSADTLRHVAESLVDDIARSARIIIESYKNGGKTFFIGNGGSAADAQHLAAELVGRFMKERSALSATALTTDTSILTALANDYNADIIFSRQIEAHGKPGDVLIVITTSGNSSNIIKGVEAAKERGLKVVGFLGKNGGKIKGKCHVELIVPSDDTQHIQEAHIAIGHIICGMIENSLFD